MILVDVNILLYAYHGSDELHRKARDWWEQRLSGTEKVWLDWSIISGFVRISTNPRVYKAAPTLSEVVERVATWFQQPNVRLLLPMSRPFLSAISCSTALTIGKS